MEIRISGMMIYYHEVCDRKLWYFLHEVRMEQENELVHIGKILDESSYPKDDKHISIDNVINIDFIRQEGILHEIKKSKKIENASIWQVKYYLYYLKQRRVDGIRGKIDYPLLKQTLEIELSDGDCKELDRKVSEIQKVYLLEIPPKPINCRVCKSCAYNDLCYI